MRASRECAGRCSFAGISLSLRLARWEGRSIVEPSENLECERHRGGRLLDGTALCCVSRFTLRSLAAARLGGGAPGPGNESRQQPAQDGSE